MKNRELLIVNCWRIEDRNGSELGRWKVEERIQEIKKLEIYLIFNL